MGALYKIENTLNGMCYYGQTVKSATKRIKIHIYQFKRGIHHNDHMQNAWNKHGPSVFKFDIIAEDVPVNQLDDLERKLIEVFQTMNPDFGYNKESGGSKQKKCSPESIEKNRQSNLRLYENGYINPNKGRPANREAIERGVETKRKKFSNPDYISPHKGKVYSERTKDLIRQAKLQFYANGGINNTQGKPLPPEVRKKISLSNMRLKAHNAEPCVGPDGFIYPSIGMAAKVLGFPMSSLRYCVRLRKPYKGQIFSYLIDK
jgi:group I intron endonuclease